MTYNIENINGNEIINFLNSLSCDNYPIDDISISQNSYIFEKQYTKNNKYTLEFSASYNNWGTNQNIPNNKLYITKDNMRFSLNEPFDGDGTDHTLETILKNWMQTYTFKTQTNLIDSFNENINYIIKKLPTITFNDIEEMNNIVNLLIKTKSLMK